MSISYRFEEDIFAHKSQLGDDGEDSVADGHLGIAVKEHGAG
jgi:hypothetical protein